ncbi:hypothetical protein [Kitasatospora sp. NPDC087315]
MPDPTPGPGTDDPLPPTLRCARAAGTPPGYTPDVTTLINQLRHHPAAPR